ncbi:hypothetical protein Taro_039190, partial [Colocasia esculenta]|nr:hypothetical protein [Colocasia esculenta]
RCLKCGSKDHRIRECPNLKKFVPRDVPATATMKLVTPAKENVLAEDDIDDVIRGETGVPVPREGAVRSDIEYEE